MAKNGILKKLKTIFVLCLTVVSIFCLTMFTLSACGSGDSDKDPKYTKTETDDAKITNGSFEFGTADVKLTAFPRSSITGWTAAVDSGATSSAIKSGIIETSEEGFTTLLSNLYSDNDFVNYLAKKYDFDVSAIRSELERDNPSLNSKEIDKLLKERLLKGYDSEGVHVKYIENFENPGVRSENGNPISDTKIYMLNNYRDATKYYNFGTAQKLTSSSTVTIKSGNYGKISVWVKTANIVGSGKAGANIRLITTVNAVTQETYAAYGIKDTEWTRYDLYVKADEKLDCTVKVVLGLGFGGGLSSLGEDYTEGTAYFDDVVYTELTPEKYATETGAKTVNVTHVSYVPSTSSDTTFVTATSSSGSEVLLYDLDVQSALDADYFTAIPANTLTVTDYFTKSNTDNRTSKTILGDANSSVGGLEKTADSLTIKNLKNAAYTLEIDSPMFTVEPEGYRYFSFKINNKLARLDSNGVSVFVKDYKGTESKLTSVATFSDAGEETVCNVLVKNNFNSVKFPETRNFKIIICVGPYIFSDKLNADEFATGEVILSDFKTASGKTYQYKRTYNPDGTYVVSDNELTDGYNYYSLMSGKANKTVALYAGENADYSGENSNSYTFTPAPSDIGTITSAPADVNDYLGITADHAYIKSDSTNYAVNTSATAGLINTKYLSSYSMLPDVATAIGSYTGNIQPLTIYNETASAYGYIGPALSVSASTYYTVSVKVRVVGEAKAYIYLVDATSTDKTVAFINTLSNTDGYSYTDETATVRHDLMRVIDSSMMDTTGENRGWLTVTFYIATGATAKNIRLEMWNGGRDGAAATASKGYVFFDTVSTANTFTEPTDWTQAFTASDSVLYTAATKDSSIIDTAVLYKRVLTSDEITFNKTASDDNKVSYKATYIYAENKNTVYAIYNTVDPVITTPTTPDNSDDTENSSNFSSETFWLQFSTILLAVVLILALIALVVKAMVRKRKANKNDAKSYYTVKSRYTKPKEEKSDKKVKAKDSSEAATEVTSEEPSDDAESVTDNSADETNATAEKEKPAEEQTLDEYVYNDVQDFGDIVEEPTTAEEQNSSLDAQEEKKQ